MRWIGGLASSPRGNWSLRFLYSEILYLDGSYSTGGLSEVETPKNGLQRQAEVVLGIRRDKWWLVGQDDGYQDVAGHRILTSHSSSARNRKQQHRASFWFLFFGKGGWVILFFS